MPEPLLLVIHELGADRSVRLGAAARLGRGSGSDVVLVDQGVSRLHAQVTPGPDGWLVEDAGSRNGTLLNGNRLSPGQRVRLQHGDAVQLGGATVTVTSPEGATIPVATGGPAAPPVGAPASAGFSWTPPGGSALAAPPVAAPTSTWHFDPAAMRAAAAAKPPAAATVTGDLPATPRPAGTPGAGASTAPATPGEYAPTARPADTAPPPVPGTAPVMPGIVRVGRAIDNDIAIADPRVASYHLDARWSAGGLLVRDLGSGSTTVDGAPLTSAPVHPDSTLYLGGSFALPARALAERLAAGPVMASAPVQRAVPELEHLLVAQGVHRRVGAKSILQGVDFSVRRGQFVAVAGASGAGKSTLMNVLNSYVVPDEGVVDVVRTPDGEPDLGYVPQEDIIHRTLTLREAVVLSAMLRFPPGTPRLQVEARCEEVLTELGLREHADTRVDRLSGGQRKRASVALELMTRPRLLLLDEPTSGLDPASDRRLIALLSALADSGYGIVLITHTTTNIDACDTVAFLAPGGRLVFWGSPAEARTHFGVANLEEVYEKLEDPAQGSPEDWLARFAGSQLAGRLQQEVAQGRREFATLGASAAMAAPGQAIRQPGWSGAQPMGGGAPAGQRWGAQPYGAAASGMPGTGAAMPRRPGLLSWQFKGLSNRYLQTLLADRRTLIFMLLQAPIIVLLARILFPGTVLTAFAQIPDLGNVVDPNAIVVNPDDAGHGIQLLFLLGTTLVWLGTINAAREICKEAPIWQRERHAGVRPQAYLLSKFLVLGLVCAVQTILWLGLILVCWSLPDSGSAVGFLGIGMITALSGVALGLVISAAMPTPDRAVTIVPIVMIPQLLFSGAIIALPDMGGAGQAISVLFSGRWAFEGLGRLVDPLDRLPPDSVVAHNFDGSAWASFFALVALTCAFGAISALLVVRRDAPPARPRQAVGMQTGWPGMAPAAAYPPGPGAAGPWPGQPPVGGGPSAWSGEAPAVAPPAPAWPPGGPPPARM